LSRRRCRDTAGRLIGSSPASSLTGPILPLIWRSMPDLGPSFRQFADGLKEHAER
jgi:hypothetical protein